MSRLNLTPETLVSTSTAGNQRFSRIATLDDGGYVIVWQGAGDGAGTAETFFQRYDADGSKIGAETLINTANTTGTQANPDAAGLANGGFVIVWQNVDDGQGNGVMVQTYNSAGAVVTSSQVNSTTDAGYDNPAVIGQPGGGFIVTWNVDITVGTDTQTHVFQRLYDGDGHAISGEMEIGTDSYSDIAVLADGSYVITWGFSAILARHFQADGTPLAATQTVSVPGTTFYDQQALPQITATADGGYVIAWTYYRGPETGGYYFQRYNAGGHRVGSITELPPGTYSALTKPAMAVLSDRSLAIAVTQTYDGKSGIFVHHYDDHGALLGPAIFAGETSDDGIAPQMTALADGGFVVTWSAFHDGTGVDIVQRVFSHSTDGIGDNLVYGTSGADVLDGGDGSDIMAGGRGDDTYIVDNAGDTVFETIDSGTDTVKASVSFSLSGQHIENLTLTGAGNINGTGNSLVNTLTGNSGDNILDGKGGADSMIGGLGDDSYYVDNIGDVVAEANGEGSDTIISSVSYSLAGRFVETLTLNGTAAVNATGNSLNNTLSGNNAANVLNGGYGADTLTGHGGADIFLFGTASGADTITDFSAAQGDSINVHAYTSGTAHTAYIVQAGGDVQIHLGGSNVITVTGATVADVSAHMVW